MGLNKIPTIKNNQAQLRLCDLDNNHPEYNEEPETTQRRII